MRWTLLPLAVLVALPAAAQAAPPSDRWQVGFSFNLLPEVRVESQSGASQYLRYTRKDTWTPSLLASCRVLDLDGSHFSLTGEYQFRQRADLEINNIGAANPGEPGGRSTATLRSQAWAPGVSWDFRRALDFGFGLQYRFARLEREGLTENYDRPWINAYLGYTFRTRSQARPFVALRQSLALTRTDSVDIHAMPTEAGQRKLLRALDAEALTSLQFGLRF